MILSADIPSAALGGWWERRAVAVAVAVAVGLKKHYFPLDIFVTLSLKNDSIWVSIFTFNF